MPTKPSSPFAGALLLVTVAASSACARREPEAPPAVTPSGPAAPSASAEAARGPFELLWATRAGDWTHQIELSPTGDVLVADGSRIFVLDAQTGKERAAVPGCRMHQAGFGLLDGTRAALLCNDEILTFDLTSHRISTAAKLETDVALGASTAIHSRLVVAADEELTPTGDPDGVPFKSQARVRLFDTGTWKQLAELKLAAESVDLGGVAIAPSGTGFAVSYGGSIELREAPSGRATGRIEGRSNGMAYSPDGALLFARDSHGRATVVDLATKRSVRSYPDTRGISRARWLANGDVVAAGEGGLWLLRPDGTKAQAGPGDKWHSEALAVSADGKLACAGDAKGKIRMYRLKAY